MKQLLGLLVVTVLVTSLATAQFGPEKGKMTLGPALEVSLPMGDFSDIATFGVGGTARFEYGLQPKIALTANIGYLWWSGESNDAFDYSVSAVPLIAGIKYSFAPQFFVSGELGFYFTSVSGDFKGEALGIPGFTYSGSYDNSETNFMLAPGVGYQTGPIEALVRFWLVDSGMSNFALMVSYNFPISQ
jgi:hypothetical protein